jgi:uncharacterized damage-inducible protein DinB
MSDITLRELVYGRGAHVDLVACVEDVPSELATRTAASYPHSIWQIVEHISYWMDYELKNIAGENSAYPDHAIESWPAHPEHATEEKWKAVTGRFGKLLAQFAALSESGSAALDRVILNSDSPSVTRQSTVRTIVMQIVAHNSYHAGQIALLRRQSGIWPPRRGGDTW